MELDDEVCLCFHVSKRKLVQFMRVQKPRRATQLSLCSGAGTGCGWCVKILQRLFDQGQTGDDDRLPEPTSEEHRSGRARYLETRDRSAAPAASPQDDPPTPEDSYGHSRPH
ncbi:MAG: (2Fe-2S)-binding protein [Planctomycetota bacterium]|nr:MAG: (2Fe-2S)-binding protein [Planctomycetota bacterium]